MGTFTISYAVKTFVKNNKAKLALVPFAYYVGHCYDQAILYKSSMMKGQSRKYAHLRENRGPDFDPWYY
ncbi:unnamed protein product [Bursaphelenchus okinawaensis]|uniref:Uncharacterized protein n=1 Tax=Bursaphelenchus okinawaensis TaxID=465554 RepID=A0A811LG43_9BILA|nr:unnamed protein product [Bursaphelenchus okinawaensis]CAG9122227.1 unnamed protein product [Bursaphelenchus okinawaensis]